MNLLKVNLFNLSSNAILILRQFLFRTFHQLVKNHQRAIWVNLMNGSQACIYKFENCINKFVKATLVIRHLQSLVL